MGSDWIHKCTGSSEKCVVQTQLSHRNWGLLCLENLKFIQLMLISSGQYINTSLIAGVYM